MFLLCYTTIVAKERGINIMNERFEMIRSELLNGVIEYAIVDTTGKGQTISFSVNEYHIAEEALNYLNSLEVKVK